MKQEHESYQFYQNKIEQCDKQINAFLQTQINSCPEKQKLHTDNKPHKRLNKNAIKGIDLNQAAFQYFGGVDLMQIEGISHATILSIMSEVGPDGFQKFENAKQFSSWLRLAPNNKKAKYLVTKCLKVAIDLKLRCVMQQMQLVI